MSEIAGHVLGFLFGCRHEFGFPITRRGSRLMYQVCVHCGAEFEYDWTTMSRREKLGKDPHVRNLKIAPDYSTPKHA